MVPQRFPLDNLYIGPKEAIYPINVLMILTLKGFSVVILKAI